MKHLDLVEWLQFGRKLGRIHEQIRGPADPALRTVLCDLVVLAERAPDFVQESYRSLSEEELAPSSSMIERFWTGNYHWSLPDTAQPLELMRSLGRLLRAADEVLAEAADCIAPSNIEERWRGGTLEPRYVIHRTRRWLPGGTIERQPIERRGILRHRLIPLRLSGRNIKLIRAFGGEALSSRLLEKPIGGGVFSGLEFQTKKNDSAKTFFVSGVSVDGQHGVVQGHVSEAISSGCFAIVWPELTMPPDVQAHVTSMLQTTDTAQIQIAVLGSWHEHSGDEVVNRARVLNGYGEELLIYEKRVPFTLDGYNEGIRAGESIPVLLLDDLAVSFAICFDFCRQTGAGNPYVGLDVDVMLVPSCGMAARRPESLFWNGLAFSRQTSQG